MCGCTRVIPKFVYDRLDKRNRNSRQQIIGESLLGNFAVGRDDDNVYYIRVCIMFNLFVAATLRNKLFRAYGCDSAQASTWLAIRVRDYLLVDDNEKYS